MQLFRDLNPNGLDEAGVNNDVYPTINGEMMSGNTAKYVVRELAERQWTPEVRY